MAGKLPLVNSIPDHQTRVQLTRLREAVEELSTDILDGRLVEGVSLLSASSPNVVPHKLGRELRGYVVVLKSADARIWDEQAANTRPSSELHLRTSADCTATIWCF